MPEASLGVNLSQDIFLEMESRRLTVYEQLTDSDRAELGQYFTDSDVAQYMASMFDLPAGPVRILDAGAGIGILSVALVERLLGSVSEIILTAYEIDPALIPYLEDTLEALKRRAESKSTKFTYTICEGDFILEQSSQLEDDFFSERLQFDLVIANPPYRKLNSNSAHRIALSQAGIETSNLYAAFIWLAVKLLSENGQIVSINPRSFANGPYFLPFRKALVECLEFKRVHLFESRKGNFKQDSILQENIIFHAVKRDSSGTSQVLITSSDRPENNGKQFEIAHQRFIAPDDPDLFFHMVPTPNELQVGELMRAFTTPLDDLQLKVSTGKVVDFRAREFISRESETNTVPLIYPGHLENSVVKWPRSGFRKANYFRCTDESERQLVPKGFYVVTKRFTSKEEKRRLVAATLSPDDVGANNYAIENHLNYFHQNGSGLPKNLAYGLSAFLNSSLADNYFRQFNGHTQVNATDLRNLRYPSEAVLSDLGKSLGKAPTLQEIDSTFAATYEMEATDPIKIQNKIDEALQLLKELGVPKAQQNERSALTLLALLRQKAESDWADSRVVFIGITQMMDWFRDHFGVNYAPNTRETIRRQSIHQFVEIGLVIPNPDDPSRPVNSPKYGYEIEPTVLKAIQTYGTAEWAPALEEYLASAESIRALHDQERKMNLIEVKLADGTNKSFPQAVRISS